MPHYNPHLHMILRFWKAEFCHPETLASRTATGRATPAPQQRFLSQEQHLSQLLWSEDRRTADALYRFPDTCCTKKIQYVGHVSYPYKRCLARRGERGELYADGGVVGLFG